jgi:hypothetical protein
MGEGQHPIETRADAAEGDLAERHIHEQYHAAQGQKAVMHRVGSATRVGGDRRKERRRGDAEAHLFALHVTPRLERAWRGIDIKRGEGGIAMRLGPIGCRHADEKQNAHHGKESPVLALVLHHAAEHVSESRGDADQQQHLDEASERRRVFIRMGGVRIEEPAAVGAKNLDHFLRGDWSLGYCLLGTLQRRRIGIGVQILRHALPDEEKGYQYRNRQ